MGTRKQASTESRSVFGWDHALICPVLWLTRWRLRCKRCLTRRDTGMQLFRTLEYVDLLLRLLGLEIDPGSGFSLQSVCITTSILNIFERLRDYRDQIHTHQNICIPISPYFNLSKCVFPFWLAEDPSPPPVITLPILTSIICLLCSTSSAATGGPVKYCTSSH
jgi:hypothetical protein